MANDRRVTFLIGANVKNFTAGLNKAQRRLQRFGRKMERTGESLSRSVSAPLAAIGGLSVKAAADFESSFADIRKTVDATEQQFGKISEGMRDMAKTVPTSVNELNRIGGVAGQLGIEAENIVTFTETIAKLGDTTDIAGEQAALSLSRFMNVMGTSQEDIDRLGSTIVGLGNNFAAMESEIVDIATSMAPLGNSIGLTEQQVLSFAATIASSGGKVEAASTAFQKTANTMKRAVIEGNEDLQVFAETAGMSASEFQRAFQKDAAGAITEFLGGLRKIQAEGGSVATVLDKVGLADQRLVREFGKVLGNLEDLIKAFGIANTEFERNTALSDEAQKRYNTFNSKLEITWNRLYDLGIVIGNKLIPFVERLNTLVTKAAEYVSNMSEESLNLGLKIAGIATAIGPTLLLFGKLSSLLGSLLGILAGISWPVVLGVTAFVTAAKAIYDNWDMVVQYFTSGQGAELWSTLKTESVGLWNTLKELFKIGSKTVSKLWAAFGDEILFTTSKTFEFVASVVKDSLDLLTILLYTFNGEWSKAWNKAMQTTEDRAQTARERILGYLDFSDVPIVKFLDFITPGGQGGFIMRDFKKAMEEEAKKGDGVEVPFVPAVKQEDIIVPAQIDPTMPTGASMPLDIDVPAKKIKDQIISAMPSEEDLNIAIDWGELLPEPTAFQRVWDNIELGFDAMIDNLKDRWGDGWGAIQEVTARAVQMLGSMFGELATGIGQMIGNSLAGVEESFATGFEQIILIVLDFANRLASLIGAIGGLVMFINPGLGAGMLAAAIALSAVASGISAGINKRVENRRQRTQENNSRPRGIPGMANGGIVPDGFPNDTYPAMLTSGEMVVPSPNSLPSDVGRMTIHNVVNLDGEKVWENQKQVNYKKNR